ncbi:MAG: Tol-Pal system beta propeller repeat protein TolB [Acidocella sp. 20-63-7]|nr:MAG: Tol-Pal system beta propeller repeat protein TolB [Acidocella sp. 20-63-7]HQT46740.1 Tol-Pal system beta propeller repeat protein TolB [Acidocella sp.]
MKISSRILSPFSRRSLLGTGAATLIAPAALAQSMLGGGGAPAPAAAPATAPGNSNNGPAINVSGAQNAPIPIAVSPFSGPSGAASDTGGRITGVLSDDLNHSGLFRAIDPSSFVPNSVVNGTPVWQNWSILGAQALITGDVSDLGGGQLRVEFRLWNVASQAQLQGTAYTTTADNWRRIAHIIGDVVYQQMVGEKGYFDSRVAYISEVGPVTSPIRRLAVMDYDGANSQFLTDGSAMALSPMYNPTRQQLAFVSFQNNNPRVYLFDLQTGTERLVGGFGDMTIGPRFSPDGNSLLMSVSRNGGAAIVRVSLNGGGTTELTDSSSINVTPCYSPDGSQIVFNSDRDGNQQLFVMNADGSGAKRISYGSGQYAEPCWSPRGDLIAYTFWGSDVGGFSIGVMQPDGSGERILSQGFLVEATSFCPNGRVVMFYRQTPTASGHDSRLVTIGVDGFNERLVDTPTNASDPSWGPLLA